MILVHSTKKLLARLPVDDQGFLPRSALMFQHPETGNASPLGGWHANVLTLQRRTCVLMAHDETRFPLFIPALKKADLANLDSWFSDVLMNALLKCGATEYQMDKAMLHIQRLQFDNQTDRSVQGTMNQMGQDLDYLVRYQGLDISHSAGYRLSAELADRPCHVKGRRDALWPMAAFLTMLEELPEHISINPATEFKSKRTKQ